ncbi:MAG: ATP-binding protein [Clostridiales bacterium]|nr:ATP-binding protein [Clostridiales bacterium]
MNMGMNMGPTEVLNSQFLVSTILSECMSILPFRLLALYLFRRQIRIPVWITVVFTCVLQILQSVVFACVITSNLPARMVDYGFGIIFFVFLLICIRSDRWRILLQFIFLLDYSITTQGISRVVDAVYFHGPKQRADILLTAAVTLLIFAASAPLVTKFLKKSGESTAKINAPFFWRTVWILPAINTVIVLIYTNKNTREDLMRPQYFISRTLLFLSMYLVYVILMRILDVIRREAALEKENIQKEQFIMAERTRQEQLERYLLEMRQIKHDNRQHLRVMNDFIEREDYDSLKSYIKQFETSSSQNAPQMWCANHTANVLISYYAGECHTHGINFSAEVYLPEQLPVSDPDFCSILGNLLENALTACLAALEMNPFIRLRARTDKNQIILTLDNTCAAPPQMEGEAFCSTKHEGMGIGTASIRSVAEKYHGSAQFRYEDHVFFASVLLFSQRTEE